MIRKLTKAEAQAMYEAREHLRKLLPPGGVVQCVLKHVSRSGMQREIGLYAVVNGELAYLTGYVRTALGERIGKHEGIVIGGCGMDMGFALVSNLSYALYPTGFGCIGRDEHKRCPSNDHSNGDRDYSQSSCDRYPGETHEHTAMCHWHKSGDYALRHSWI